MDGRGVRAADRLPPVSLIRSELRVVTGQPGLTAVLLGPVLVAAAVRVARMVLHVADPLR